MGTDSPWKSPRSFEFKWFEPYEVIQKMLLGTYRLQDLNGRELAALGHGNRLIEAKIRTADELKQLWASSKSKDILRKRNKWVKVFSSYSENIDILDEQLQNDDENDAISNPKIVKKNFKGKRGQEEIFDKIFVQQLDRCDH